MKIKTFVGIALAAAAGYFIAKDKLQKETVKMLVKQDLFESSEQKYSNEVENEGEEIDEI